MHCLTIIETERTELLGRAKPLVLSGTLLVQKPSGSKYPALMNLDVSFSFAVLEEKEFAISAFLSCESHDDLFIYLYIFL